MSDSFELDLDRRRRLGFPEVIFGASKTLPVLIEIIETYQDRQENALATKLQPEIGRQLAQRFPTCFYDETSGIFMLNEPSVRSEQEPLVGILAAGASDAYVANEAHYTLSFLGLPSQRVVDVGVAGIHRLINKLDTLHRFKVLIVVAGFEGALPTVAAGLLPQPLIAVPTSVGYGVASGGHVALNTMLSSCANGVTVVNIDNGYGAAMAAFRILKALGLADPSKPKP